MLSHVSSFSIITTKSCLLEQIVGDSPPTPIPIEKPFRIILVKRFVGSYRHSLVLKLSHGAITNIELLLSYVVLRVGQMSYTA